MRRSMKPTSKEVAARRNPTTDQKKKEPVGASMVDALEDILRWERASERLLKAAPASESGASADLPH